MKRMARLILLIVFLHFPLELGIAQAQPNQNKAAPSKKTKSESLELGKSYASLRPEQKQLVDDSFGVITPPPGATLCPNSPTTTPDCPSAPRLTP